LWRTHFGADPSVIGRSITLNKQDYLVVGVAMRGFTYPDDGELWVPLNLTKDDRANVTAFNNQVIGKLRRGATVEQAGTQVAVIAQNIVAANPALKDGYALRVTTLLERRVGHIRSTYLMLFGAAGFVLLIACANLASLLLSRGFGRQHWEHRAAELFGNRWWKVACLVFSVELPEQSLP